MEATGFICVSGRRRASSVWNMAPCTLCYGKPGGAAGRTDVLRAGRISWWPQASSVLQMCFSFSWEVRMGWSVSDTAFLCGHSQPEMPVLAPFGEQVSANAPPSGPSPSLASHPGPSASLPVLPRPLDMPGFVSLPHWPVSVMGRPLSSGQDP